MFNIVLRKDSPDISPNQHVCPLTTAVASNGMLHVGGCAVDELAAEYGTPLWIVDRTTLRTACKLMADSLQQAYSAANPALKTTVLFAAKSWPNLSILNTALNCGLEVDVASLGELETALAAGFKGPQMWFHGNNKSEAELERAVQLGVHPIVDNWHELSLLEKVHSKLGLTEPVEILVRIAPGVSAHTHSYISTGEHDTKFGFPVTDVTRLFVELAQKKKIRCVGIHCHIGSQVTELKPYRELPAIMISFYKEGLSMGLPFRYLNLGGGLGTAYTNEDGQHPPPRIQDWVSLIAQQTLDQCQLFSLPPPHLLLEAGRCLVSSSTVTLYSIGATKQVGTRRFISVDGGMSDNIRPAFYGAQYTAVLGNHLPTDMQTAREIFYRSPRIDYHSIDAEKPAEIGDAVKVVGKHCESGDVLINSLLLRKTPISGDFLVVFSTGAYNASMSSNYNKLTRPMAIMVENGKKKPILKRETIEDLLKNDILVDF